MGGQAPWGSHPGGIGSGPGAAFSAHRCAAELEIEGTQVILREFTSSDMPGVTDTDMIHEALLATDAQNAAINRMAPLGEIGTADDIARVALFLASDAGKFVTGQAIAVDGGITA